MPALLAILIPLLPQLIAMGPDMARAVVALMTAFRGKPGVTDAELAHLLDVSEADLDAKVARLQAFLATYRPLNEAGERG